MTLKQLLSVMRMELGSTFYHNYLPTYTFHAHPSHPAPLMSYGKQSSRSWREITMFKTWQDHEKSGVLALCTPKTESSLTDISYFSTFHFAVLLRHCVFHKLKVCGNSLPASLLALFSQQHLFTRGSAPYFGNFCTIPNFFIIILLVIVTCDL